MNARDPGTLVIGSGIAGLSAAIHLADQGLQVILASPFHSERAQSVMAAGGINAVLDPAREGDSTALHARETLSGGCFLESAASIERLCAEAPDIVRWLESIGVVFSRNGDGGIATRAFGGQSKRRTAYAGASTGKQIVTALVQKCREHEISGRIRRLLGLHFHSALIKNGACYGAVFADAITGELTCIRARAVIMATGGMNKLFGKTTGSELCDGYAAGQLFCQGARMRNLEFVQFHPTSIETSHKRMLVSEAARGEGGRLYYLDGGERVYFMEELFGPRGNLMSRDIVAKHVFDCPSQVYLDIAFLGEGLIHERLEEVYELCKTYLDLDVTQESIPVAPAVHFFMGGIWVDDDHRTSIEGLYAVGECASKYHGANRLGGNSLLAAVYAGRVAARHIAATAPSHATTRLLAEAFKGQVDQIEADLATAMRTRSTFPSRYIEQGLADCMNRNMGVARNADRLKAGIADLDFYLDAAGKLSFDPQVSLYESYRLRPMLTIAKAAMESALARQETRGAHIRTDFPDTYDVFAKCSIAEFRDGKTAISLEDATGSPAGGEASCS